MEFPKPLMSLKELNEMGFGKTILRRASHCSIAPYYVRRVGKRGKIYFDTKAFNKYLTRVFEIIEINQ